MKQVSLVLAAFAAAFAPASAWAHDGHGAHDFAGGLLHPVTGVDHFAVMLLVGLAAALFENRDKWFVLAAFPAGLLAGFVMSAHVHAPIVEAAIIASLVVLGLGNALRLRLPLTFAMILVAGFGYAHGAAHGIEIPADAAPAVFAAGFLLTSLFLHAGGYWLAQKLPVPALRAIGAAGTGLGLVLAGAT